MRLNRLLKFVKLDEDKCYIFKGNDARLFRVQPFAFDRLRVFYYGVLGEPEEKIDAAAVKRAIAEAMPESQTHDIPDLFLEDDHPPVMINELDDLSFFQQAQQQFCGFFVFPTYRCNLNCTYCTYSGVYPRERRHMPVSLSGLATRKTIDYIRKTTVGSERVNIVFYGDEPLLNFDALKTIQETLCSHDAAENKYRFQIITNGVLLTEETVRYCSENRIKMQISLDGPPDLHDRYRQTIAGLPTHSLVMEKLNLIRRIDEQYFLNMVTISCTLAPPFELERVNDYFLGNDLFAHLSGHNGTFSVSIVNMEGGTFYQGGDIECFRDQVTSLKRSFIDYLISGKKGGSQFLPSAMYEAQLYKFVHKCLKDNQSTRWRHAGECLPGVGGAAIGADGQLYVCNTYNLTSIGCVDTGVDYNQVRTLRQRYLDLRNSKCRHCWLYRFCPVCIAAFKYSGEEDDFARVFNCDFVLSKADDLLSMYIMATELAPHAWRLFLVARCNNLLFQAPGAQKAAGPTHQRGPAA